MISGNFTSPFKILSEIVVFAKSLRSERTVSQAKQVFPIHFYINVLN